MAPASGYAPLRRAALAATLAAALSALAACGGPRPAAAPAPVAPPAPRTVAVPAVNDSAVRAISDRLLADSAGTVRPLLPVPRYALDVDVSSFESHDLVSRYVTLFTGEGRERFAARLQRGTRFDPLIRGRLRAAGLPEDLTYLALVESGYDPNAVSRASAVGMWQFMAGTARELGLRVDWWVDERRDPVKSTDAAVRNLRWLRKEFGSLFLAAAAYNGGPGRVSRGLAQLAAASDSSVGESRFFALADGGLLRSETANYVPQIIAATLVATEPERYGIALQPQPAFAYDSAFVRGLTPLAAVASAARTTREELLDLNPQILRGMTPPGEGTLVRLPAGSGAGFAARIAAMSPKERRAFHGVETKARETVEKIASRQHVPAAEIRRFNPELALVKKGKRKGTLVPGQLLRIPSPAVLAYARAIGDVDGDGPSALPTPVVLAEATKVTKESAPEARETPKETTPKEATSKEGSKESAREPVREARETAAVRAAEDGGEAEGDAPKPPKGAKRSEKSPAKASSGKGASSKASSKAPAKAGVKSSEKASTKPSAKSSTKRSAKSSTKPSAKSSAKATTEGGAKTGAKPSAQGGAKAGAKGAAAESHAAEKHATAKHGAGTKKAAGKPAAGTGRAKSSEGAKGRRAGS